MKMLIRKTRIPVLHILLIGVLPSFLKKIVYRMKGYKIGKKVKLSPGCVIIGRNVIIADGASVGFLTLIRGREITIGRYVKIGSMSVIDTEKIFIDEDARINEQVFIGGMKTPQSSFYLGKRAIIMQLSYINPTLPVKIDDDSGIGGHCLLFTHGSWNSMLEGFPVKFAPITIGKKVWLPWRVFVMPGVEIGDQVVIGANSLISKNIPANCIAAGSPAKVIKENVPVAPDEKQQEEMLNSIFKEFVEYLEYFELKVQVTEHDDGFVALVKGNKSGMIRYFAGTQKTEKGTSNSIAVFFDANSEALQEAIKNGFGMAVSVLKRKRIGSCASGEELLTFFSRYGIRFERMD